MCIETSETPLTIKKNYVSMCYKTQRNDKNALLTTYNYNYIIYENNRRQNSGID